MSMAIRTCVDTVVRAVPTRRQQLRGAIENGLRRPGPDDTYAGDDATWMAIDWPSMTRHVLVEGREVNVVVTDGDDKPLIVLLHGLRRTSQTGQPHIAADNEPHRV